MRWLLAALILGLALAALGAGWLLGTQAGLEWAAARLAAAEGRLSLQGLQGALARDIAFDEIRFADGSTRVRLAKGALRLDLLALLGGRAGLRHVRATTLEITLADGRSKPTASPPSLPVGVRVERAEIGRMRIGDVALEDFELSDAAVNARGQVLARAAFTVREAAYPAQVELRLQGTVERLEVAISARIADVPLSAKAVVAPFAGQPLRRLEAQAGEVDLRRLRADWPRTALTLHASGAAAEGESQFSGTLMLGNAHPGPLDSQRLPLDALEARFATDFSSVSLTNLHVTGAGTLSGNAQISSREAVLELRADGLDLRALRSTLRRTSLAGPLTVTLTEDWQEVEGTLSQQGMSLAAHAVRRDDVVEVRRLRAQAGAGEATGSARLRLGQPLRFRTALQLARLDPASFGDYPQASISGQLQASGTLGGAVALEASWALADSTLYGEPFSSAGKARLIGQRVSDLQAQASLSGARLHARGDFGAPDDQLALEFEVAQIGQFVGSTAGRLSGTARVSGTWQAPKGTAQAKVSKLKLPNDIVLESLTARVTGSLAQHEGELLVRGEGINASAQLRGGWQIEQGWKGELLALRNAGAYPLQLSAPAPLELAPERLALGPLKARFNGGTLLVRQFSWSPSSLSSSGEFEGLPAHWLLLAAGLTHRARTSLLLDGQWNLAAAPKLSGTLTVRRAAGDLVVLPQQLALGLDKAELEASFAGGAARFTAVFGSRYGMAEATGNLQGFTAESPVNFSVGVRFAELRSLLQPFLQDARIDGRLVARLQGSGTLSRISLRGTLQGDNIAFQVPPYGVFLKEGELRAVLEGDRLRVERLRINGSGGQLTASGTLPLDPEGDAHLDWRAERFGVLARPDLRLTVSGAGEARLAGRKVFLSGALRADRGYLELQQEQLPRLGADVVIAGQPRAAARERRARVPVGLDLRLDLGENLEVRGYGLEGRLTGKLQLETAKDGELRAYGRIRTVNATFLAYGQRLQVDPGIAIFDGPLDNPSLQMTAWRRNQQVEAGVQISGTARAPRVQLVSQPPVPEGERLSWLVLGRAPSEASKADLGLLQAAAGALLARGDRVPLDRRIARAFGVDEISLRGSGEVGDRVVAVGKRLSDRLYVSYEHGLGVLASALVKLDLALTQRLSVRAETGTSSGVGLFYRFSWD